MYISLEWESNRHEDHVVLDEFPATIGRGLDVQVHIQDPCVSRRHCEIEDIGESICVHDLNSKNGTFVNGHRVHDAILAPGDTLHLGGSNIVVRYERHEQRRSASLKPPHTWQSDAGSNSGGHAVPPVA